MQTSHPPIRNVNVTAANTDKPINVYLGWEIFLSRVFRERTDKGLWLHWHHPFDQNRKQTLRYGHFISPDQTLEEALYAVYQSIEAIIELESMENDGSFVALGERLEHERALLSANR